ncbi:kinase-like domain-containing protein [Dunaliella salina]|uniref:[RNA-polymerase]-subunit kinase n=1 Tax=Dunaliella salina TaxID=3046 RepID=A0ABQ7GCM0_DUNSA|nr:kinase-like domain-containing protein [Dunaliella salina]|eukprot:KAF5832315.1 kinase-like domain-containing protein [Dunaliella salina]
MELMCLILLEDKKKELQFERKIVHVKSVFKIIECILSLACQSIVVSLEIDQKLHHRQHATLNSRLITGAICVPMENYVKGPVLGTGTFASVFKATHKETGEVVAIKKISITDSKEGVHVTALREMKLLREIQHPNVIALRDVFPLKKNIALVLPFMESDLEAVIRDRAIILSPGHIKSFMKMLLSALHACHSNWIVHRDVKPNNCLLASDGQLVLADFGESSFTSRLKPNASMPCCLSPVRKSNFGHDNDHKK